MDDAAKKVAWYQVRAGRAPTPVQSKSMRMEKKGAERLHRTEYWIYFSNAYFFLQR
jgi:hypothetical protein